MWLLYKREPIHERHSTRKKNYRRRSQLPCPNIKSITLSFPLTRSISKLFSNSSTKGRLDYQPLFGKMSPHQGAPSSYFCSTRQQENLSFYIENICWEPLISNVQSTVLPSSFLRSQPWICSEKSWKKGRDHIDLLTFNKFTNSPKGKYFDLSNSLS